MQGDKVTEKVYCSGHAISKLFSLGILSIASREKLSGIRESYKIG